MHDETMSQKIESDTSDYCARIAGPERFTEIISLLENHYIHEDIVARSYMANENNKISQEDLVLAMLDKKKIIEDLLSKDVCLIIVEKKSERIAGAVMLVIYERDQDGLADPRAKDNSFSSKLVNDLVHYSELMNKTSRIFELFPDCKRMARIRFLAVHAEYRQRGLCNLLMKESVDWALRNDFDIVQGTFTTVASKRAAERSGLTSIQDYNLREFRDLNGFNVFADASPNNILSLMVLNLR
ncbi:uncharacterized protein LOC106660045 [Trichogramma pretiosum]|uniref:uncharacterized protein LOC106660045 n=1 Tax=Trichogramma pretiosum TaxID=7493 RepID=UPI0006C9C66E|nr:uncharacterized protein LOC106660045 [Trichogramma pretiosum]